MTGPTGLSKKKYPKHPNPRPERVIDHRGIKKTLREWSEFIGKSKDCIRDYEHRGRLTDCLDHALRTKGLMP